MCSWSRARMFTAKPLASSIAGRLRALRSTLKRTSGGSSETELNELMVSPMRSSCLPRAVTTATPVANSPRARLNARSCIEHLPRCSALNYNFEIASLQSYLEMSSLVGDAFQANPGICRSREDDRERCAVDRIKARVARQGWRPHPSRPPLRLFRFRPQPGSRPRNVCEFCRSIVYPVSDPDRDQEFDSRRTDGGQPGRRTTVSKRRLRHQRDQQAGF